MGLPNWNYFVIFCPVNQREAKKLEKLTRSDLIELTEFQRMPFRRVTIFSPTDLCLLSTNRVYPFEIPVMWQCHDDLWMFADVLIFRSTRFEYMDSCLRSPKKTNFVKITRKKSVENICFFTKNLPSVVIASAYVCGRRFFLLFSTSSTLLPTLQSILPTTFILSQSHFSTMADLLPVNRNLLSAVRQTHVTGNWCNLCFTCTIFLSSTPVYSLAIFRRSFPMLSKYSSVNRCDTLFSNSSWSSARLFSSFSISSKYIFANLRRLSCGVSAISSLSSSSSEKCTFAKFSSSSSELWISSSSSVRSIFGNFGISFFLPNLLSNGTYNCNANTHTHTLSKHVQKIFFFLFKLITTHLALLCRFWLWFQEKWWWTHYDGILCNAWFEIFSKIYNNFIENI